MTDAPERIFAANWQTETSSGRSFRDTCTERGQVYTIEYIRADLAPDLTAVLAQAREALERASVQLNFMAAGDDDAAKMAAYPLAEVLSALAAIDAVKP